MVLEFEFLSGPFAYLVLNSYVLKSYDFLVKWKILKRLGVRGVRWRSRKAITFLGFKH